MTYQDAVALLGGPSKITNVLDKASSLALFGTAAIDLFDARAEAVRLGDQFIRRLRDRVKGLSRYDTTRRLWAAHAVIVVTAYLEALAEVDVLRELTPQDQRRITGTDVGPIRLHTPQPSPDRPYEQVLHLLWSEYAETTDILLAFLSGLACWDKWSETQRDTLRTDIPVRSIRRYEELFRRLAAEFPEVACWADRIDHQATRAEVRSLARGLAGIEEQLARIPATRHPSERLTALIRSNQATLGRPILSHARTPAGMTIPTLDQGYVNPGYRLLGSRDPITSEEAWAACPRRDDLDLFLTGHLTTPAATDAPLLVLGQPGAGKSVLTRMLAARLPAGQFLPLRVELRAVLADSDVLAQIEHGIRTALDEPMSWPDFVHAAEGALPVVMLDGFDELLQATGVNQADYLERVAQFQRDQAEKGHALAVVVTSRTAVADRARVPSETLVVRLEPFDEAQIRQWATTWNDANHGYFGSRDLEPFPLDKVLGVRQLAGQPLLLTMLALYDADTNALRHMRDDLHEAELYERLLHGFALREVGKSHAHLTDEDLDRAVEDELLRLSITAFAMFNRGLQWIEEHDLDADLEALHPQESHRRPAGFRRALTRAEGVIGGFFFIHTTQALRDNEKLKTYEFLHATFGEYLVARLIVRELADMAEELAFAESRRRPTRPDDAYLHALLSFAALNGRSPIVDFLKHGLGHTIPPDHRALLTRYLCELFSESLRAKPRPAYDAYEPVQAELTARCAAYSANLMVLAVLSSDKPITGAELFRVKQPEQANERWRRMARLWHSQLSRAEFDSLMRTIAVRHFLRDGSRTMEVAFDRDPMFDSRDLVFFTWPDNAMADFEHSLAMRDSSWMREISFRDDTTLGHLFVNLLPYMTQIDPGGLDAYPHGPVATLLAITLNREPDFATYRRALAQAPTPAYVARVLRQLELDAPEMAGDEVLALLRNACEIWDEPEHLWRIFQGLADRPDVRRWEWDEMAELLSGKAQDHARRRPFGDFQVPSMGPGDVPGDGQAEPAPPGVP